MPTTIDPEGLANLEKIKHIVVLMMENRSFDQMLGYLKRADMPEVDGLTGTEQNLDAAGNPYPVHEFGPDETTFHRPGEPFDKSYDPCHGAGCVAEQLAEDNGGFVKNFIKAKKPPSDYYGLPMGYYTAQHLPVYDFLAHQYCVCDAWHCSIPGDTWLNRQYAVAAQAGKPVLPTVSWLKRILKFRLFQQLRGAPIYDVPAFTRHLADGQWRWYSHDPATLRGVDSLYRKHVWHSNFCFFDRKKVSLGTQALEWIIAH